MNRRDFLKSLVGIPLLGFLKPEVVEAENVNYSPSLAYTEAYKRGFKGFIEGLEASGNDLLEATKPVVEAMAKQIKWTLETRELDGKQVNALLANLNEADNRQAPWGRVMSDIATSELTKEEEK